MFCTFRRLKTEPGTAALVAELIESEYLPLLDEVEGFIAYTLVELRDDEISGVGEFTTAESADEARCKARIWTAQRHSPPSASPQEAQSGDVLARFFDVP